MKVDVFIEQKNQQSSIDIKNGATVLALLRRIGENPVAVVVAKNGKIVTEEAILADGDKIKVFSVVSGG